MKITTLIIIVILLFAQKSINAQVAVTNDGSSADPSAMLEIKSTDKGLLLPRMTQAERDAIPSPVAGLVVWCTNCGIHGEMQVYNGNTWTNMVGGTADIICGADFIDSRDGRTYGTVLIGTQCWMAENLNVGTMLSGGAAMSNNGIIEKYCYNNLAANCDKYGGIYGWDEMMQYTSIAGSKGICPDGWHLPVDAEWCILEQYLDATISCNAIGLRGTNGGGKLKEVGTTNWTTPNTGANNASGFTALPGGRWFGVFSLSGTYALWWTSSQDISSGGAWARGVTNTSALMDRNTNSKNIGMSVRCVKN
jgi:uncharacterized protein (TIGR02145 family)